MMRCGTKRHAVAAMWALVVLAVLTSVIGAITWQTVAGFRQADRRHAQLQALWLARAGVELAISHVQNGETYSGETAELIPHGHVKIQVSQDPATPDHLVIVSEARFPAGDGKPVVRVQRRSIRRGSAAGRATP